MRARAEEHSATTINSTISWTSLPSWRFRRRGGGRGHSLRFLGQWLQHALPDIPAGDDSDMGDSLERRHYATYIRCGREPACYIIQPRAFSTARTPGCAICSNAPPLLRYWLFPLSGGGTTSPFMFASCAGVGDTWWTTLSAFSRHPSDAGTCAVHGLPHCRTVCATRQIVPPASRTARYLFAAAACCHACFFSPARTTPLSLPRDIMVSRMTRSTPFHRGVTALCASRGARRQDM